MTFSRKWYKQENQPEFGGYSRIGLVSLAATVIRYHKIISYPHLDIIGTFCLILAYTHACTSVGSGFLGEFAKLQKATVSFVMSVRPSVRMELLGSH